jgi:DNA repair photolyase
MNNIQNSTSYDFANIFSGKCNAGCPYCIGQKLTEKYPTNLDTYPLPWMELLISMVKKHTIPEIIFTGTTTDPLLYRHQLALLEYIQNEVPGVRRQFIQMDFLSWSD